MTSRRRVPRNRRLMLDLARLGLEEVPLLGVHVLNRATRGLAEHMHPGLMEICYLVRGSRVYSVGGRDYVLKGNDLFVTLPDERHGSGPHIHGRGQLFWMQVALPPRPRRFLGLSAQAAWPLVQALRRLPARHVPGVVRIPQLFESALRLGRPGCEGLGRLRVAAVLTELLLRVVDCAAAAPRREFSADIAAAVNSIAGARREVPTLAALARAAGLSLSRFKAKFREQVGIPPREYILRRQIERAQELLATSDRSVTEVAMTLGFSSSQYFATVFRRYTNATPSQYRRRRRAGEVVVPGPASAPARRAL